MDIQLEKIDDVFVKVNCEPAIAQELSDYFTFLAPNYKYDPRYKAKIWDGTIKLFNTRNRVIYTGLASEIEKFCRERSYEFDPGEVLDQDEFSIAEAEEFFHNTIPKNLGLEMRDYQIESFALCVRNRRMLFLSPTASGKSFIIYLIVRYYKSKTLIIVDSLNLLRQMFNDFKEYGFEAEDNIHLISSGADKKTDKQIIITTWQSAVKQPKWWFDQFSVVIGDEAHKYKAKSLIKIMSSLTDCPYRFGFTGTLDGIQTNKLVLEGLFGKYNKIVTTKELQDEGYLADLEIKSILLKYDADDLKKYRTAIIEAKNQSGSKPLLWETELSFLLDSEKRNRFIKNLALSLKGNTLILFRRVHQHGIPLYEAIKADAKGPVYYVSGKIKGDEREEIRQIVNKENNAILVASEGTFSTGVNIPNIDNIIFTTPTKSQITVLQSIGRGLRKSSIKSKCTLFDISDDLSTKTIKNYSYRHLLERIRIYKQEQFPFKLYRVELK